MGAGATNPSLPGQQPREKSLAGASPPGLGHNGRGRDRLAAQITDIVGGPQVLTDPELAADLRARSLQQAARFNWRKTATETLAIYEEAYKRSRKR